MNGQIPGLTQFTTNNDLPSNTVYDIIQDELGFMWFATDYGISKFDGISFENYTVEDGLPGNEILFFYKDSQNRIWLSPFNGNIGFFKNGIFHNQNNTPFLKKLKFNRFVWDIYEDSNKNIYFFQDYHEIKVIDQYNSVKNIDFKGSGASKVSSIIIEDKSQNIHVLSHVKKDNNSYIISKKINSSISDSTWIDYNPNLFTIKSVKRINTNLGLLLSKNNNLNNLRNIDNHNFLAKIYNVENKFWITNLGLGIQVVDKLNSNKSPKTILKNVKTNRAFIDLENNIWVGSESNGAFLFPNVNVSGVQFEDSKKNDLYSINEFNNDLIVGNGFGELIGFDKLTLAHKFSKIIDNQSRKILQLQEYHKQLYVVSDFYIHCMDKSYTIKQVKNMYDPDFKKISLKNFKNITFKNETILTANSNGIAQIDINNYNSNRIWNKRSSSILQIGNDSLWVGTTTGLFLKTENDFKKFSLNNNFDSSIIYDLKKSEYGLLVASNSYGLGILNKSGFKNISVGNGLLSNYIKSIHVDTKNNIWLSSNLGLNKLVLDNSQNVLSIVSYTTADGLYSNDVRACIVDYAENNAYVATSNGLNIIDISKTTNITNPPRIIITDKLVNNKSIFDNSNSEFKYHSNNFQFNFSGISFKSLGDISFKYRLLGIENEWIETKNNTIRYSSLQPNSYTFEVKAVSKSNIESLEPEIYSFIIHPPFYKTIWFSILSALLFIGIGSIIYFIRRKRRIEKHKIEEQIESLRFKALNAQMNPHFINNLLGNINDQIASGKFNKVEKSLKQFGNLVNLILAATKSNLISLKDEIEMTSIYLQLQKSRFHKNLNFEINLDKLSNDDIEYILVPPMILQPIVENSIKHGFNTSKNNENKVHINLSIVKDEFLKCELIDNGTGFRKTHSLNSSGISLENISNRLKLMGGLKNSEKLVSIEQITNDFNKLEGSKVILKIPLIKI